MSSQYIQEPPTSGKVCLHTTAGPIDVELWAKECPKACRNFIQLCMEGYYDKTVFHRVVPGFIVQGGDPTGTGEGGESIYGRPFRDEFHQRLKFVRRGLVAMANGGPDDNGSQFFFTLDKTPELDKKHSIFGKVTGNTLFNMLTLGSGDVDGDSDRPINPHRIKSVEILSNPFDDILPRKRISELSEEEDRRQKRNKSTAKATKNRNLLSFADEEDEEDGREETEIFQKISKKGKSAHDVLNDESLSRETAVLPEEQQRATEEENRRMTEKVREKLRKHSPPPPKEEKLKKSKMENETESKRDKDNGSGSENSDVEYAIWSDRKLHEKKQLNSVKAEVDQLRREMQLSKSDKNSNDSESNKETKEVHPLLKQIIEEKEQFKAKAKSFPEKESGD